MKAFNKCSVCGNDVWTIVRTKVQKDILEINNPYAICKTCQEKNPYIGKTSWRRVKKKD